jgi:hypothetical protein
MFGVESLLDMDNDLLMRWRAGTPTMIPAHIPPFAMFSNTENKERVQVILVTRLHTDWMYDPTGGRAPNFLGKVADELIYYRPGFIQRNVVAANGMLRRFVIGGPYKLAIDTVHTDRSGLVTVYMSSYAPQDATHVDLKSAAIETLREMLRQVAKRGVVYRMMVYGPEARRAPVETLSEFQLPRIVSTIEADWRNDRLKFAESRESDTITISEASDPWIKHCVAKVFKRTNDLPRAFAICTAQGQKSGYYKPGSRTQTKAGKTRARSKAAKKGHSDVLQSYEKALDIGAARRALERLRKKRSR